MTVTAPTDRAADLDALLDLTSNPADRLWRYPLCHKLVRYVMNVPVTPNNVTLAHSLLAVAGGVVIAQGTPRAFVLAGVMFEVRAVLDCFDGVVARAKKMSSPLGRAIDQLGDTVGFVSLMAGGAVCLARIHGWPSALAVVVLTSTISSLNTTAWDFYRRRFTSLIKHGYDSTEDEYVSLLVRYADRPGPALWVSRAVSWFGWVTLSPQSLPRMRARAAQRDLPAEGEAPAVTALGEALQAAARRNDPELRAMLVRVGVVAGDNVILLLTVSLLVGQYLHAFPLAMAWGLLVWGYTVVTMNRYLHEVLREPAHEHLRKS